MKKRRKRLSPFEVGEEERYETTGVFDSGTSSVRLYRGGREKRQRVTKGSRGQKYRKKELGKENTKEGGGR